MIKRVIFDIDNTLIPWKKEYDQEVKYALEKLKISYTEDEPYNILKAVHDYENKYYRFDMSLMAEFINKYTNKEYPKELLEKTIEGWSNCAPNTADQNIIKLLEYLSSKYELVLLTDWFKDEQEDRLRKMGILKYFSYTYSAEKANRKPFKEAFIRAIGNNKPEECIMVGDNFERDIQGALKAGLKAIYYTDNFDDNINNKEYYTISKLDEIMKIL